MTGEGRVGSKDPMFDDAYIDVDEWRDEPVRHRYVHGGFRGTDARFSMYFPTAERYEGRFFHPMDPVGGNEHTVGANGWISVDFATDTGAYIVETNNGKPAPRGPRSTDPEFPSVNGYRASAAAARYSRVLAAEMYGDHRPFGYCFGGSGGGVKTIACMENTTDVWDGAVPFIHPHMAQLPTHFGATLHMCRALRPKIRSVIDAIEPGGSGDLFEGLNVEERETLAAVLRLGFPPRALFDFDMIHATNASLGSMGIEQVMTSDPGYFDDFWTVPGYLGADAPASLLQARIEHKGTVTGLVFPDDPAVAMLPNPQRRSSVPGPVALRVPGVPAGDLQGAALTVLTGKASGRVVYVIGVAGELVQTSDSILHGDGLNDIEIGDEVHIDNRSLLAIETFYRHQDDPTFAEWQQFRAAGRPLYPQRSRSASRDFFQNFIGTNYRGRFAGKMIVLQNLLDEDCYPSNAVYYRGLVERALGPKLDDQYRLWFIDHAMHSPSALRTRTGARPEKNTRIIDYMGAVQQALHDVSAWVEQGVVPPASTDFEYDNGQVAVPRTAAARKGIQPVVELTANGLVRAEVAVGEEVAFSARVEVPPGAGTLVSAEWDFEGTGEFPVVEHGSLEGSPAGVSITTSYAFAEPGTYFPALRVASHRQSKKTTPFALVRNLGRVRVVVRGD